MIENLEVWCVQNRKNCSLETHDEENEQHYCFHGNVTLVWEKRSE